MKSATVSSRRASRVSKAAKSAAPVEAFTLKFRGGKKPFAQFDMPPGSFEKLSASAATMGTTPGELLESLFLRDIAAKKSATARHLITDNELRELVQTLETTVECNLIGGATANTPHRALKAWKANRATWVEKSMRPGDGAMTREEAEDRFKQTDDCANMLRRVLPIFTAA